MPDSSFQMVSGSDGTLLYRFLYFSPNIPAIVLGSVSPFIQPEYPRAALIFKEVSVLVFNSALSHLLVF